MSHIHTGWAAEVEALEVGHNLGDPEELLAEDGRHFPLEELLELWDYLCDLREVWSFEVLGDKSVDVVGELSELHCASLWRSPRAVFFPYFSKVFLRLFFLVLR